MRLTASSTRAEWPCAVSTTTRSTPASISALGALEAARRRPSVAAATRSRPCSSLQAFGLATAFSMSLTVIRPTQRYCVVDHQQLLDAVLVQQPLGLVLADALAHRDQVLLGHQLGDLLPRIGGEAHVAVGEDADQLAGAPLPPPLDHRNAGDAVLLHQRQRVGQRRVGIDGDRVDHHAGLELLDLAHLRGLLVAARGCGG